MSEVVAGTELGPWIVESVSAEKMKDFAVVLDDPNPIHLDPEVVRSLGLGDRVINQGPAGLGYLMEMLRASLPGGRLRTVQSRFKANVFGGDRVIASGTVDAVEEVDGRHHARCTIWLDVDGGARAIDATAVVVLPD